MRTIGFDVNARVTVDMHEIVDCFAQMNSDDQAIFLSEMFDALLHRCKEKAKFDSQLCWIATCIERYNFNQLKETINSLNEFIKTENK
jgi:hypothetical protein